jgi:hypothetical protein
VAPAAVDAEGGSCATPVLVCRLSEPAPIGYSCSCTVGGGQPRAWSSSEREQERPGGRSSSILTRGLCDPGHISRLSASRLLELEEL